MKKFIVLSVFVSSLGLAQQIPLAPKAQPAPTTTSTTVAEPMAGGKREIKDCTTYDGTKYKVVPMGQNLTADCEPKPAPVPAPVPKPKPKPRPKPAPVKPKPCPECPTCPPAETKTVEKMTYKTWRIYGLAGYGAHGLESTTRSEGEDVTNYYGPVFGAGISYHVNPEWDIGVQGLSNNTGVLTLGFSFGSGNN